MRLNSDLIVFDLEANQPSGKIIEIGAVRIPRDFSTESFHFQAFVNPSESLSQEIITLCNLSPASQQKIQDSQNLAVVGALFYEWATLSSKNVTLASWGNFDVAELHAQWPACPFRRKAIDIKSIVTWEAAKMGFKGSDSLSQRCRDFQVEIVGPIHRAYPDALTTANLLRAVHFGHTHNADIFKQLAKGYL